MAEPSKDFAFMNKFQSDFYTSVEGFAGYSNFDVKAHGVQLLINMYKSFPHLADRVLNWYSPPFVVGMQSPAILRALQRVNFINGFTRPRQPQGLFYKQSTKKAKLPDSGIPARKKPKGAEDFEPEVVREILSTLMMDSKTYNYLRYTERVQRVGKQLIGENTQRENVEFKKHSTRQIPII